VSEGASLLRVRQRLQVLAWHSADVMMMVCGTVKCQHVAKVKQGICTQLQACGSCSADYILHCNCGWQVEHVPNTLVFVTGATPGGPVH
jgi:hypothetical protein